jgi:pyruvate dehydrogenase E2 component (dihydrolipoamide acetyltransferase)
MTAIQMPIVGYDIKTGQVVEWRKNVGDKVEKGDVIVVVESEKSTFDVEAEASGVLLEIVREAGEEAEVLTDIGYIGQPGEKPAEAKNSGSGKAAGKGAAQGTAPAGRTAPATGAESPSVGAGKRFVSPVARRVAKERGVDLSWVDGTGPGGRVIKRDVLKAAASGRATAPATAPSVAPASAIAAAAPVPPVLTQDKTITFSKMRRIIGERLLQSKQTIPHFYLFADVAMDTVLTLREAYNLRHQSKVSINDVVVAAVARTLRQYPNLNSHVSPDHMVVKAAINIGVATSVEDGLLVPVITKADDKNLADLSAAAKQVVSAARQGKSANAEPGSFTVSSLGMYGTSRFLPIINPPQAAILGVGAVENRVVAEGSYIGVRKMMTLSLACDHRAVDGVYAAQFLGALEKNLVAVVQEA